MASLNAVVLLGNLTRDPELRTTPQGTSVASFGLAVNRRYRQGEEQREEVMFIDITCFGRQAEVASEYLSKGNLAMIEGRLQWRSWETPDGQKRSKHEVIANNIQFMPRSSGGQNGEPYEPTRPANAVRLLQELLAAFGDPVTADGAVGPQTAQASHAAMERAPEHLVDAYGIARRNYYYRLADRRPASRKYARARDGGTGGWFLPAEEFFAGRYHFTRAQHERRVAAWA
jgi:single-strand DNA-binding protein